EERVAERRPGRLLCTVEPLEEFYARRIAGREAERPRGAARRGRGSARRGVAHDTARSAVRAAGVEPVAVPMARPAGRRVALGVRHPRRRGGVAVGVLGAHPPRAVVAVAEVPGLAGPDRAPAAPAWSLPRRHGARQAL